MLDALALACTDGHRTLLCEHTQMWSGWRAVARGGGTAPHCSALRLLKSCHPSSTGADHTAGVTAGGALLTWGNGQQGQLGRVGERLSDRVKMETLLAPHPVPFKRVR